VGRLRVCAHCCVANAENAVPRTIKQAQGSLWHFRATARVGEPNYTGLIRKVLPGLEANDNNECTRNKLNIWFVDFQCIMSEKGLIRLFEQLLAK
jgi:hypothetical protein